MANQSGIDSSKIKKMLDRNRGKIKLALATCAHCSMCAESCFLFVTHNGDPRYMPSHKLINSLGVLYRKKGEVSESELEKVKEAAFERCVLCTRCYCPLGIDIPGLIALTRSMCRTQDVFRTYDQQAA